MKDRVRDITKRSGGRSISSVVDELRGYLVGWKNYFQLADTPRSLQRPRRMDPSSSTRDPSETVEARNDDLSRAGRSAAMRPEGPTGARQDRRERPTLVEELGQGDQHRLPHQPTSTASAFRGLL